MMLLFLLILHLMKMF